MRREVDWRGVAAAILALGVVAVLLTATIEAFYNTRRTVSSDEISTAATVLGAAVGAVAVYLGGGGRGGGGDPGNGGGAHRGPDV